MIVGAVGFGKNGEIPDVSPPVIAPADGIVCFIEKTFQDTAETAFFLLGALRLPVVPPIALPKTVLCRQTHEKRPYAVGFSGMYVSHPHFLVVESGMGTADPASHGVLVEEMKVDVFPFDSDRDGKRSALKTFFGFLPCIGIQRGMERKTLRDPAEPIHR